MNARSEGSGILSDERKPSVASARFSRTALSSITALMLVFVAALAALLLLRALQFWPFTLDDTFITLRYSRHLARGFGPSWNVGAAPAEGYTTVLWMLLLSLAELARVDGLWFAKVIGVIFALASFLLSLQLARRVATSTRAAPVAQALGMAAVLALYVSYWPLGLHAISGMETTFSCFVLTAFFLQSVELQTLRPDQRGEPCCRSLALTALACCLTRPEALLPCAVTLLAHIAFANSACRIALLRAGVAWLALPFVAYQAWRLYYFGLLFPLSFYVKASGQPPMIGLPDVVDFFAPFVAQQPWWGAAMIIGCASGRALVPCLLGALSLALFFIFPEHIMAFEGRYLLPLFPLLAALAGIGTARAAQGLLARVGPRLALRPSSARQLIVGLTTLALGVLACIPLPAGHAGRTRRWIRYGESLQAAHVALARDLSGPRAGPGKIALLDVGAIGYYAEWHTIDTFGLNDAHVALTRRTDVSYVLDQGPDLMVVVSKQANRYEQVFAWEAPLHEAALRRDYQTLCSYQFEPDYHLLVLIRPGQSTVRANVCGSASYVAARDS